MARILAVNIILLDHYGDIMATEDRIVINLRVGNNLTDGPKFVISFCVFASKDDPGWVKMTHPRSSLPCSIVSNEPGYSRGLITQRVG